MLGEFLGTLTLIVLGCGVGAGLNLNKTMAHGQSDWFYVTFAWGIAVTMGVYVAASFGAQGHLNPAVTIAFAVAGTFPWSQVAPYLVGQFLGAFLGAVLVMIQFWPHFKATKDPKRNNIGIFSTVPGIRSNLFNFLSELIATFVFMLVLYNLGDFTTGLKPVVVGLVIFVIGAGLGTTTGFALGLYDHSSTEQIKSNVGLCLGTDAGTVSWGFISNAFANDSEINHEKRKAAG